MTAKCRVCKAAYEPSPSQSRNLDFICKPCRRIKSAAWRLSIGKKPRPARRRSKTPTYIVWLGMRARCSNPSQINYANYGGRGIRVCDRWQASYDAFFADMGERPAGMEIDRIDVDGNYEPNNCRWVTIQQQAENKRNSVIYTINGETHTLTEWSRIAGIARDTIKARMALKLPPHLVLMKLSRLESMRLLRPWRNV